VRYSKGSNLMRLFAWVLTDGESRLPSPLKLLQAVVMRPLQTLRLIFTRHWSERSMGLLVMQALDNQMRFRLGRNLFTFFRRRMTTQPEPGVEPVPSWIPIGHRVARMLAAKVKGIPQGGVNEALLGIPNTAHILGGCVIGRSREEGVVDARHR